MPEQLKQSEVNAETDPSVAKQYENAEGTTKFKDFYDLVDDMKIGIMGTYRKGVGVRTSLPRFRTTMLMSRPACWPQYGDREA